MIPAFAAAAALTFGAVADFEYIREGNSSDIATAVQPGYVLMGGGGDVASAFAWMIERSGGGDFLVLRASGTGAYNPFILKQGVVNSAATLILKNREASFEEEVLDKVRKAEAIWFAGGDQWNYISRWKDTPLQQVLQARVDAGVPVGGTSAGLAILGEFLFSAEFGTIQTPQALADPMDKRITIGCCFLHIPALRGLITDSHFMARDRMGRLVAFLARLGAGARGIGVDEATAVLVEPDGSARVEGKGAAWFLRAAQDPERCQAGEPLTIRDVGLARIGAGGEFPISRWPPTEAGLGEVSVVDGVLKMSLAGGATQAGQ